MAIDWNGNKDEILSDEEIERILFAEGARLPEEGELPTPQLVQDQTLGGLGIVGKIIFYGILLSTFLSTFLSQFIW